jgi:hypothetical protein
LEEICSGKYRSPGGFFFARSHIYADDLPVSSCVHAFHSQYAVAFTMVILTNIFTPDFKAQIEL